MECETLKLKYIASIERARSSVMYPRGSTIMQISATNGQLHYLNTKQEVEQKYVVIEPSSGYDPKYIYIAILSKIEKFVQKYQEGLNITQKDVENMEIVMYGQDVQNAVVAMFNMIETSYEEVEEEYQSLVHLKKKMLSDMFV